MSHKSSRRMWGTYRLVSLSLQVFYGAKFSNSHVHPLSKARSWLGIARTDQPKSNFF